MRSAQNFDELLSKRWFMGKSKTISMVQEYDSIKIGGTKLSITEVQFTEGCPEKYALIEDEARIGDLLEEAFRATEGKTCIQAKRGSFAFDAIGRIESDSLRNARPVGGEQSNSSFIVRDLYFFKLYRRLQAGIHPEAETLLHLGENNFAPRLRGICTYKSEDGETYALGILEEFVPQAKNAWDCFCEKMDSKCAKALGTSTALMHKALQNLDATSAASDEPPFDKLEALLEKSSDPLARELQRKMPSLRASFQQQETFSHDSGSQTFVPQRIHGDLHLGQVLIQTGVEPTIKIMDFEGEPSRTLDFRRRLRSPAADIAGMLRSFRYAASSSGQDCSEAENAFIEGYAQEYGIGKESLLAAARPYILSKAIYEACYELEFRPTWFHIPAKALLYT